MSNEIVTLGNNMGPPVVCVDTAQGAYAAIERTDGFDVAKFNGLLMAVVTYLDHHQVNYGDKALPWAELLSEA